MILVGPFKLRMFSDSVKVITANSWPLSQSGLIKPHDPFNTAVDGHAVLCLTGNTENLGGLSVLCGLSTENLGGLHQVLCELSSCK